MEPTTEVTGVATAIEATVEATVSALKNSGFSFPALPSIPVFTLLAGAYLLIFWLALVRWVWEDSRQRYEAEQERRLFILLVILFNFLGLLIYFLLRPPLTFREQERVKKEEELLDLELQKLKGETNGLHQNLP